MLQPDLTHIITVILDGEVIFKKKIPLLLPLDTKIWMRFDINGKTDNFLVYLEEYHYSIFNNQMIMQFQQDEFCGLDKDHFYKLWNSKEKPTMTLIKGYNEELRMEI